MKCINCYKDIESKRSTKKYCNTKCRVAAHRKSKGVTLSPKTDVTLTLDQIARLSDMGDTWNEAVLWHGVSTMVEIKKDFGQ